MRCKGVAVRKDLSDHHDHRFDDHLSHRLFDVPLPKRVKHEPVTNVNTPAFKFNEWFETIRDKFSTPIAAEEVRSYLLGQNLVTQVTIFRAFYYTRRRYHIVLLH